MKVYHLSCEYDFKGANLCTNSGVYLSRSKAEDVITAGLNWDEIVSSAFSQDLQLEDRTLKTLLRWGLAEIEEIEID